MEPIISPWIIYIMSVVTGLKVIFTLIAVGAFIFTGCAIQEDEYKEANIGIITLITATLIAILIPTRDTLLTMLVASYTTPENLSTLNEIAKTNLQDYIKLITEGINQIK